MKKIKFFPILVRLLILCLLVGCISPAALALEEPDIRASNVILIEAITGQVLYEKDADAKIYPASTTKILTALVALRAVAAGEVYMADMVTFSEDMTADLIDDGSSVNLQVGEAMSMEELLYCALLSSGNDACNAIAVHVAGSISGFVDRMNQLATELGCTGSHFANAHGAPNDDHYTTARDMSLIAQAAYKTPEFITISSAPVHTVPATNLSQARDLKNSNALITTESVYGDKYFYPYCTAGKTGHTDAAGYCLVSSATRDDMDLIAVVMHSTVEGEGANQVFHQFQDSINLYEYGFNGFQYTDILLQSETLAQLDVALGAGTGVVGARPRQGLQLLVAADTDLVEYVRDVTIYSEEDGTTLTAPIDSGTVLGEVSISHNGEVIFTTPLVAANSIALSHGAYIRTQIQDTLSNPMVLIGVIVVLVLLAAYLAWVIVYRIRRLQHLKSVKAARMERQAYLDSLSPQERRALEERARQLRLEQQNRDAAALAPGEEAPEEEGEAETAPEPEAEGTAPSPQEGAEDETAPEETAPAEDAAPPAAPEDGEAPEPEQQAQSAPEGEAPAPSDRETADPFADAEALSSTEK
jgi:D-alanyl-D-alanine carboxypeptidase (penicillin-binding protein 5/6)